MKCINYLIILTLIVSCVGKRQRNFGTLNENPSENIAGQNDQMEDHSFAGAAGMDENNTGGLENNGGKLNQPISAGSSGSAGLEINNNTAGINNFGGTSNGTGGVIQTGGAGNNSGGNSCTPLTCEDFAKQFSNQKKYPNEVNLNSIANYNFQTESLKTCGEFSNGCGKKINCNSCNNFEECSVPGMENRYSFHFTSNSGTFPKFQAIPLPENTCAGGCAYIPNKTCPLPSLMGEQFKVFACLNKMPENIPEPSCVEIPNTSEYSEYFQANLYYDSTTGYKIKPVPRLFCCKPNN